MISRYIAGAALLAAVASASGMDAQRCPNGGWRVGDLGFDSFSGSVSIHETDNQRPQYRFESEIRIEDVNPDGPAAGRLRNGDVITAIDGHLITTAAAGRRFSSLNPGDQPRLTIRRSGRTQDVQVSAGARCTPVAPPAPPAPPRPATPGRPPRPGVAPTPATPGVPPTPPRPAAEPAPARPPAPPRPNAAPAPGRPTVPPTPATPPIPPAPPAPPEVMPDGWFGFGIQCNNCGVASENGRSVFRFREAPRVVNVEPGTPAAGAGMRRGDRLTHMDGVSITTAAGWRRFAAIQPGQRVSWTYTRDGRRLQSAMTALRRPDAGRAPAPAASPQAQRLRYSGSVGGSQVEVRGAPVNVTTDPRTGEMVIRSADVTVRIRPQQRQ